MVEIKWRISRTLYTQSKHLKDKAKKQEMIAEGYQTINEALALNDKHYAVHKWLSVLLDAKSEIDGIKERVSQLENVKKHMQVGTYIINYMKFIFKNYYFSLPWNTIQTMPHLGIF